MGKKRKKNRKRKWKCGRNRRNLEMILTWERLFRWLFLGVLFLLFFRIQKPEKCATSSERERKRDKVSSIHNNKNVLQYYYYHYYMKTSNSCWTVINWIRIRPSFTRADTGEASSRGFPQPENLGCISSRRRGEVGWGTPSSMTPPSALKQAVLGVKGRIWGGGQKSEGVISGGRITR